MFAVRLERIVLLRFGGEREARHLSLWSDPVQFLRKVRRLAW